MFQNTVARAGERPALKERTAGGWRTITWEGYGAYVRHASAFLRAQGLPPGERVAILGRNGPEWAIADFAILHAGLVTVPLYDTHSDEKLLHILEDAGVRAAFALSPRHAARLRALGPRLEVIVAAGGPPTSEAAAKASGTGVLDWDAALRRGRAADAEAPSAFEERWRAVAPEDLASLVYTSGTTGVPKGVELTHGNFVSNVQASLSVVPLSEDDLALSFLPLSHVFERTAGHFALAYAGACIAYAESIDKLADNLPEVRPTVMVAVPRLYEKMEARIRAAARARGREASLDRALSVGMAVAERTSQGRPIPPGLRLQHALWDRLVFRTIRARTGGCLRYFVSGGAPLAEDLEKTFAAAGLWILGGYGLTEASPVVSVNTFQNYRFGTVGKPIPGVEVRIARDGEILVSGPNVMRGYWNLPEDTEDAFEVDDDGKRWLKTGDVGTLDADGFLRITDRKKDIIVLSNGKNVAPQGVENALNASPWIAQSVVVGNGRNHLVALLVPAFERLFEWAKGEGLPADADILVSHPRVGERYRRVVEEANARLSRHETVKSFTLLRRELTQEAGELTPTLKVRRKEMDRAYADVIARLYDDGGAAVPVDEFERTVRG